MAGSLSWTSISFIFSAFLDISKKPPEIGGFFLQFCKKIFYLYQFHGRIVNGFSAAVKTKYFLSNKVRYLASDLAIAIAVEGAKSVRATG
jgi:hypothetical protein